MGESTITNQAVLESQTDGEIEHAIRDAFFLDPDLPGDPFEIRVEDGIAYIGGTNVDSRLPQRAIDVAENVQRIKMVIPVFDGD